MHLHFRARCWRFQLHTRRKKTCAQDYYYVIILLLSLSVSALSSNHFFTLTTARSGQTIAASFVFRQISSVINIYVPLTNKTSNVNTVWQEGKEGWERQGWTWFAVPVSTHSSFWSRWHVSVLPQSPKTNQHTHTHTHTQTNSCALRDCIFACEKSSFE